VADKGVVVGEVGNKKEEREIEEGEEEGEQ
jgi:hypothetical protein